MFKCNLITYIYILNNTVNHLEIFDFDFLQIHIHIKSFLVQKIISFCLHDMLVTQIKRLNENKTLI